MQTTTGTLTATGAAGAFTHALDLSSPDTQAVVGVSGTFAGVAVAVEGKMSGGSVWYPLSMVDRKTLARSSGSASPADNTTTSWLVDARGFASVRVYASAGTLTNVVAEIVSGDSKEFAGSMAQVINAVAGLAKFAAGMEFTAATGENTVSFPDDLANALDFKEGSTSYLKFVTTDGTEAIATGKPLCLGDVGVLEATGEAQGDAAAVVNQVTIVTGADAAKGVILPTPLCPGDVRLVYNNDALAELYVYPHSGGDINDGSTDVSATVAGSTLAIFIALDSDTWAAIFTS